MDKGQSVVEPHHLGELVGSSRIQMAGGSVGIAVGCILGMLPLLFIDGKKGDREESPREICTAFTRAATALLHAERCVCLPTYR